MLNAVIRELLKREAAHYERRLNDAHLIKTEQARALAAAHAALTEADEYRERRQAEALAFIRGEALPGTADRK
jgi:hypothetical protein